MQSSRGVMAYVVIGSQLQACKAVKCHLIWMGSGNHCFIALHHLWIDAEMCTINSQLYCRKMRDHWTTLLLPRHWPARHQPRGRALQRGAGWMTVSLPSVHMAPCLSHTPNAGLVRAELLCFWSSLHEGIGLACPGLTSLAQMMRVRRGLRKGHMIVIKELERTSYESCISQFVVPFICLCGQC